MLDLAIDQHFANGYGWGRREGGGDCCGDGEAKRGEAKADGRQRTDAERVSNMGRGHSVTVAAIAGSARIMKVVNECGALTRPRYNVLPQPRWGWD